MLEKIYSMVCYLFRVIVGEEMFIKILSETLNKISWLIGLWMKNELQLLDENSQIFSEKVWWLCGVPITPVLTCLKLKFSQSVWHEDKKLVKDRSIYKSQCVAW